MSDSDDDQPLRYELQKYSLIRFVHRGRKRRVESIDIVPSKWLDFDKSKARCVTKFMEAPYNEEDLNLIHTLVVEDADAPEDWPCYTVEQVGRARTYEEALQKIEQLGVKDHVLTLESEDSASDAQRELTLAVKRQKLQAAAKKLTTKFSSSTSSVSPTKSKPTNNSKDSKKDESENQTKTTPNTKSGDRKLLGTHKENASKPPSSSNQTGIPESASSQEENNYKTEPENAASVLPEFNPNELIDLPIIDLDNVACKTQLQEILSKLDRLSLSIGDIKSKQDVIAEEVNSIKHFLSDKKIVGRSMIDFNKKYQLNLPLATYEDFETFEQKLQTDHLFKKDVYGELKSLVDKDYSISKSIVKMLRKFLTKNLALQFTAIRSSPINKDKYKFRPRQLCTMMETVIVQMRAEKTLSTEEDVFNGSLSDVFTNIYKWK